MLDAWCEFFLLAARVQLLLVRVQQALPIEDKEGLTDEAELFGANLVGIKWFLWDSITNVSRITETHLLSVTVSAYRALSQCLSSFDPRVAMGFRP